MADLHAFAVPWFTRAAMPEVNELFAEFTFLTDWEANVAAIGEGERSSIEAVDAHGVAKSSISVTEKSSSEIDARYLSDDARRGGVTGKLTSAFAGQIALMHENDAVCEVVVHFPRMGYRVKVE